MLVDELLRTGLGELGVGIMDGEKTRLVRNGIAGTFLSLPASFSLWILQILRLTWAQSYVATMPFCCSYIAECLNAGSAGG